MVERIDALSVHIPASDTERADGVGTENGTIGPAGSGRGTIGCARSTFGSSSASAARKVRRRINSAPIEREGDDCGRGLLDELDLGQGAVVGDALPGWDTLAARPYRCRGGDLVIPPVHGLSVSTG